MITDPSDQTKKIIFHPKMLPAIVIVGVLAAGFLLGAEESRALVAATVELDRAGDPEHVVELRRDHVAVDPEMVAVGDGNAGRDVVEAVDLEDHVLAPRAPRRRADA